MKTKTTITKTEHEVAFEDIIKLCRKHADKLSKVELLAVAANMVGKLLALQDQTKITPDQGLNLISKNIEQGNREAIKVLLNTKPQGRA